MRCPMMKINQTMIKTALTMLQDAEQISISEISPYATSSDMNRAIYDITKEIQKSKGKDLTVILSRK